MHLTVVGAGGSEDRCIEQGGLERETTSAWQKGTLVTDKRLLP